MSENDVARASAALLLTFTEIRESMSTQEDQ